MTMMPPSHLACGSDPGDAPTLQPLCDDGQPASLIFHTWSEPAPPGRLANGHVRQFQAASAAPSQVRASARQHKQPQSSAQRPQHPAPASPAGSAGSSRAPLEEVGRERRERRSGIGLRDEFMNRGAISQLQEFVQGAKLYPMPPNCPVLQWDYDTRMTGTSLKFRATVAFLLDGVPHHAAGSWRPSKKLAQRDAAERALGLFVNRWGALALSDQGEALSEVPAVRVDCDGHNSSLTINGSSSDPRVRLEDFCSRLVPHTSTPLQWSHRWEGESCQAFVEIRLMEVAHTFPGKACRNLEAAYLDVAKRVLWYLQCPGFEDAFEPDFDYVRAAAQTIPEPITSWVRDADTEGEDRQAVERKTIIMRVQSRLQQAYAQQLDAGDSPWHWSFEKDAKDKGWPPLFRATVHVPLAARTFVGSWHRGQKDAQVDTCAQIAEFLDQEFPLSRAH